LYGSHIILQPHLILAVLLPEDVDRQSKHVGEWPVIRGDPCFLGPEAYKVLGLTLKKEHILRIQN